MEKDNSGITHTIQRRELIEKNFAKCKEDEKDATEAEVNANKEEREITLCR